MPPTPERFATYALRLRNTPVDEFAWDHFVPDFWREVVQSVVRILRDGYLAEDVAQEVFQRAVKKRSQIPLQTPEDCLSWLRYIARMDALSTLRKLRRLSFSEPEKYDGIHDSRTLPPLGELLTVDCATHVWEAVGQLEDRYRICLTLQYLECLEQAEIASLLGITIGTLRVNLHRGRLQLRDRLRAYLPAHLEPNA